MGLPSGTRGWSNSASRRIPSRSMTRHERALVSAVKLTMESTS